MSQDQELPSGGHFVEVSDRTGGVVLRCHKPGCEWGGSINANPRFEPVTGDDYAHLRREALATADAHRARP